MFLLFLFLISLIQSGPSNSKEAVPKPEKCYNNELHEFVWDNKKSKHVEAECVYCKLGISKPKKIRKELSPDQAKNIVKPTEIDLDLFHKSQINITGIINSCFENIFPVLLNRYFTGEGKNYFLGTKQKNIFKQEYLVSLIHPKMIKKLRTHITECRMFDNQIEEDYEHLVTAFICRKFWFMLVDDIEEHSSYLVEKIESYNKQKHLNTKNQGLKKFKGGLKEKLCKSLDSVYKNLEVNIISEFLEFFEAFCNALDVYLESSRESMNTMIKTHKLDIFGLFTIIFLKDKLYLETFMKFLESVEGKKYKPLIKDTVNSMQGTIHFKDNNIDYDIINRKGKKKITNSESFQFNKDYDIREEKNALSLFFEGNKSEIHTGPLELYERINRKIKYSKDLKLSIRFIDFFRGILTAEVKQALKKPSTDPNFMVKGGKENQKFFYEKIKNSSSDFMKYGSFCSSLFKNFSKMELFDILDRNKPETQNFSASLFDSVRHNYELSICQHSIYYTKYLDIRKLFEGYMRLVKTSALSFDYHQVLKWEITGSMRSGWANFWGTKFEDDGTRIREEKYKERYCLLAFHIENYFPNYQKFYNNYYVPEELKTKIYGKTYELKLFNEKKEEYNELPYAELMDKIIFSGSNIIEKYHGSVNGESFEVSGDKLFFKLRHNLVTFNKYAGSYNEGDYRISTYENKYNNFLSIVIHENPETNVFIGYSDEYKLQDNCAKYDWLPFRISIKQENMKIDRKIFKRYDYYMPFVFITQLNGKLYSLNTYKEALEQGELFSAYKTRYKTYRRRR